MIEYWISFHLKIMQIKIPSLHTLEKCVAHAYDYDTLGGGGGEEVVWTGGYEGTSDGTWCQKAYDNVKCSSVRSTNNIINMKQLKQSPPHQ
jgi:hypothetical protein